MSAHEPKAVQDHYPDDCELCARVTLAAERKSVVAVTLSANGVMTVRGEVVAVRIPASMAEPSCP